MSMTPHAIQAAAARLFSEARTHSHLLDQTVSADTLRQLYEWAKWGPTSLNCQPMRVIFAQSADAKARLSTCVNPGNVDKVNTASIVVVIGGGYRSLLECRLLAECRHLNH